MIKCTMDACDKGIDIEALSEATILTKLISLGVRNISKIHILQTTTSTNDYLLKHLPNDKQTVVCLAEQQTRGRGRYGHNWESPAGVNIYLSISWPIRDADKQYEVLGLWLLHAMAEWLEQEGVPEVQLKWPNDLCVQNKKLAGVLIERKVGQTNNNLIIGIGLNVAMSKNKNIDIDNPWIDLLAINSCIELSRNNLAANLIATCNKTLEGFENDRLKQLPKKWYRYDMLMDQEIIFLYKGEFIKTYVLGIDELGRIKVELEKKIMHLHSSQIRKIRLTGVE